MKILLCFSQSDKFICSYDYIHMNCPEDQSVQQFLADIEKNYFSELKIVQVNFESGNESLFSHQQPLYPCSKAQVYILIKYDLKTISEISKELISRESENQEIVFEPMINQSKFLEKTELIVDEISKGRIYQVNLTSAMSGTTSLTAEQIFYKFESLFKGDYKALLPSPQFSIISFSPELFLQQIDGELLTRPIKGSLPGNRNFSEKLIDNKKEEAELSMIVDLMRNDLNSLSDQESAVVSAHRQQMQLDYIQHTFSEIKVKCEKPLSEVLKKTFPGGSISGCPKRESLKIISELEPFRRQAYTGALGWWQKNQFGLNVTIRSFIKAEDQIFYHAGCGIVYDSLPESEWQEFLLKAGTLNVK